MMINVALYRFACGIVNALELSTCSLLDLNLIILLCKPFSGGRGSLISHLLVVVCCRQLTVGII